MGTTSPAPRVATVRWLGGRDYKVEDLRELPGRLAFMVTAEDQSVQVRVVKGSELETEIAALIV